MKRQRSLEMNSTDLMVVAVESEFYDMRLTHFRQGFFFLTV